MALKMGPVLSFRGCDDGNWNLTAVVVSKDAPGPLTVGGQAVNAEVLWDNAKGGIACRYGFAFPMAAAQTTGSYSVDGETYVVTIPAVGQSPTMAYGSCNGFSSLKLMKDVKDKNALWKAIARQHGLPVPVTKDDENAPVSQTPTPYHLLLLGGDQVYADAMWETVPLMKQWNEKSWAKANAAPLTDKMQQALDDFYFDLYTSRWSQEEVARVMACIPSIAMWDDHDFMDGWGSYPPERQDCDVFGGIWKSASKAFAVFQQHLKDGERRPGTIGVAAPDWWQQPDKQQTRTGAFSFAYIVGKVAILAVDMRSQRTEDTQVVGEKHWKEIYNWMDHVDRKVVFHILVMSSIPVIYPDFKLIESLLGIFPGHQDLEDDLRDHWNSPPHKGERTRLIKRLLDLPKRQIRTTLISGDVHVAALGIVQALGQATAGPETVVNQLISSGIVHPGPGGVVLFALQQLFDSDDQIDPFTVGRMTEIPGSKSKFIGNRNYMSLEPIEKEDEINLWCHWLVVNEKFQFTKVIHSISQNANLPQG